MIVLAADYVGVHVVRMLLERRYPVTAVVLHSSDPRSHNETIKELASQHGSTALLATEADLKRGDYLERLAQAAPRVGILAWWPSIIQGRLLEIPSSGWLNLHPSFLPFNRGRHPNFWCLATDTPCGASLHFVDRGIDTGPVIAREAIETTWEDTGASVYMRTRELVMQLFSQHIDAIVDGRLRGEPQDPGAGSFHLSSELVSASEIDLDEPTTARQVLNRIRARTFPPYPGARFTDNGDVFNVRVEITRIAIDE